MELVLDFLDDAVCGVDSGEGRKRKSASWSTDDANAMEGGTGGRLTLLRLAVRRVVSVGGRLVPVVVGSVRGGGLVVDPCGSVRRRGVGLDISRTRDGVRGTEVGRVGVVA